MNRPRLISRIIRRVLFVIAFMIVVAAGCTVWDGTCALPHDLLFSDDFAPRVHDSLNSPGQVARLFFDEMARQLGWHGTSRVHEFKLTEVCENEVCFVEYISIDIEIEHLPICSWADNHYNHSLVTVTIDDFRTMEVEFAIETTRVSWGSYEQSSASFFAELERVQRRARLSNRYYKRPVRIKYNRYYGNFLPEDEWNVGTATAGNGPSMPKPVPGALPMVIFGIASR